MLLLTNVFLLFWLLHISVLSDPNIFPRQVREAIPKKKIKDPESVNFDTPSAKLLDNLYEKKMRDGYKKVKDGVTLFTKLDPEIAYSKCRYLRDIMNKMYELCQSLTSQG
ncbi:MAG: DUF4276 family protein [Nitrospirae bacterium]|nr:DUF4276 family protein [Nitrospirota bacterium]